MSKDCEIAKMIAEKKMKDAMEMVRMAKAAVEIAAEAACSFFNYKEGELKIDVPDGDAELFNLTLRYISSSMN